MSILNSLITKPIKRALDRFASSSAIAHTQKAELLRALLSGDKYAERGRLSRFEHQSFSQGGEDGIVREIFRRIGTTNKNFVEIGVGDGLENNTALLLYDDWKGVWLEGNPKSCSRIRRYFKREIENKHLSLIQNIVTAENASNLILGTAPNIDIDFLSIDVDRNTYYVWEALASISARVVAIEYNALLPADLSWKVDYDASKWWNGTSYFGASLKALELLGTKLGYNLVGCDMAGVNAFFVRKELCNENFCAPFNAENHYEPPRYYLHHKVGHPRLFRD
jgi:hypothetical protein